MKKTRKILAVIIAVALVAVLFAACDKAPATTSNTPASAAPDAGSPTVQEPVSFKGKNVLTDQIKIYLITISTAGVSNRLNQLAVNEQLTCYPNVSVEYKDSEYDPSKQVTLIEEAITQGVDAIILECMDPVGVNGAIEAAEKAGIPVISFNAAKPSTTHTFHVRMDDWTNGWLSGQEMARIAGGEGTAVILDCPAVQKPSSLMGNGFEDYINDNTNIKFLEPPIPIDNWSSDNAQIAMRDLLTKYGPGEITMVFCANDDIANGAMNAIDAAGRNGEIILWGLFGYPAGLEGVKSGRMTGTMFSDVYVQLSMLFYVALDHISSGITAYNAGYEETPHISMPMFPVTAENVDFIMVASRWFK